MCSTFHTGWISPFSQLKCDWKETEMLLNGIVMPFSHISRPFSEHSVDWVAEIHPVPDVR